jgi:sugar transferase (PEP-CTERM/EpsH1 system associated)
MNHQSSSPLPAVSVSPTASKIRVAHVVLGLRVGGLERVVVNLVRGTHRTGAAVGVYCLDEGGPFTAEVTALGVPVHILQKKPGIDWTAIRHLAQLFRRDNVQVVHTHNPTPHFHGVVAAWLARVPVCVHTKHGRNYPDRKRAVWTNHVLAWFTDAIVPVSDNAAEVCLKIEKVNPKKIRRIWNGVDVAQYAPRETLSNRLQTTDCRPESSPSPFPLSPCPPIIGTVARLSPEKDQKTMLEAFKLVLDGWQSSVLSPQSSVTEHCKLNTDHSPRLVVIGDGPCRAELEAEAQRLGITGQVDFLGMRSDIPAQLLTFDLFTLSSISEGISMTILEAMACGLPIVATDVGGNREIVNPPQCGLIVPLRDPRALASAYLELLRTPSRRAAMGTAARQRVVEHFSCEQMVKRYADLYAELLKKTLSSTVGNTQS